jgi:ubiquinone/menaquinone biosynthesis C-methylase UbiE
VCSGGKGRDRPFAGDTASFYRRYRRDYPGELLNRLLQSSPGARGRLLDLGCGTGQLVLQLAGFFEQAVGIDPEPDMLGEAKRAARERGIRNIEWIEGSSADLAELEPMLGRFELATIGTAFHFMEPRATLGVLRRITAAGIVAVAYSGSPMWLHPDPWAKALRTVLEARLGQLSDTDFTAQAVQEAEKTMRDLGYTQIERWEQTNAETITVDFVVGHILSATSADQVPPAQRRDFARELASAISAVAPTGLVVETVNARAIIGHTHPRDLDG